MTGDSVCTECGLDSIFEALAERRTHNSSVCYKSTELSKLSLVCVYTVKTFSVFSNAHQRVRESREIQMERSKENIEAWIVVLNGTYIKTVSLHHNHHLL